MFLVTYFAVHPDVLVKYDPDLPISQFLKALPGFHIVGHVMYPGDIPEYVYVFRKNR